MTGLGNYNYNNTIDRKPAMDHIIVEPAIDRRPVAVVARQQQRQRRWQQRQILVVVSVVELGVPETVFVAVQALGVVHQGALTNPLIQITGKKNEK